MGCKLDGPTLKQPTFEWSATDKYAELRSFALEENNIFQHKICTMQLSTNYENVAGQASSTVCRRVSLREHKKFAKSLKA